jgi:hypothetical protein
MHIETILPDFKKITRGKMKKAGTRGLKRSTILEAAHAGKKITCWQNHFTHPSFHFTPFPGEKSIHSMHNQIPREDYLAYSIFITAPSIAYVIPRTFCAIPRKYCEALSKDDAILSIFYVILSMFYAIQRKYF